MIKKRCIKQGEIYIVDFSVFQNIEHEQNGVRPVIVISADIRNDTSPNVFVFPITHAKKKSQPCHYKLYKEDYPFFSYKENIVLCEEGRSISKKRLQRKLGEISLYDIENILKCKEYIFIEKE